MQLPPWPSYSTDMSPIENVRNLVGRRLARDPHSTVSKDEPWMRIQTTWNSLPQAGIQRLVESMSHRITALIAAQRVVITTNTNFGHLILFIFCFEN
ncbi:hypothetical protein TNCV_482181 [Trichonephila clavipes]|uniref:Uncharacterized protein n=1 Tax=Trichonephila clavipes TaxID=2585209 RepID=A0A8X6SH03_TRICX|nr:hypothetical protein TNCV_482181 [Trichonephila clavipes]